MLWNKTNAAPDGVGHVRADGAHSPRAVAHCVAVAGQQLQPMREQDRVDAEVTGVPAVPAPALARRIEREGAHRLGATPAARDGRRVVAGGARQRHESFDCH